MQKSIPIVFASDENYAVPLYVSIRSLLKNVSSKVLVDIYIMIPGKMPTRFIRLFDTLISDRCKISFLNMGSQFVGVKGLPHITSATCYRLALPELLKQYDKCIYLDCDIVVTGDIAQLYDYDLGNNLLAGVKEIGYHTEEGRLNNEQQRIEVGLDDWNQYINAGVLLMNIAAMRTENLNNIMVDMVNTTHFKCLDQDVLNKICYGRIIILPLKFNAMTKYVVDEKFVNYIGAHELQLAQKKPVVVHFLTSEKPWYSKNNPLSDIWWDEIDEITPQIRKMYIRPFLISSYIKWKKIMFKKRIRGLVRH